MVWKACWCVPDVERLITSDCTWFYAVIQVCHTVTDLHVFIIWPVLTSGLTLSGAVLCYSGFNQWEQPSHISNHIMRTKKEDCVFACAFKKACCYYGNWWTSAPEPSSSLKITRGYTERRFPSNKVLVSVSVQQQCRDGPGGAAPPQPRLPVC